MHLQDCKWMHSVHQHNSHSYKAALKLFPSFLYNLQLFSKLSKDIQEHKNLIGKYITELSNLLGVPVTQLVKRWPANLVVTGSSPAGGEGFFNRKQKSIAHNFHYHPPIVLL